MFVGLGRSSIGKQLSITGLYGIYKRLNDKGQDEIIEILLSAIKQYGPAAITVLINLAIRKHAG